MRRILTLITVAALAGCAESTPTAVEPGAAEFNRGGTQDMRAGNQNKLVAVFNTQLRAQEERPHTSTSMAKGHTQIKIYEDGTIEWMIKVQNPANELFWGGHIHEETMPNETGPVRVPLFMTGMGGEFTDRHLDIRGSTVNPTQAQQILENPEKYYVNLHTRAEPAGAIRGQLR
jgi:hypothetical protein